MKKKRIMAAGLAVIMAFTREFDTSKLKRIPQSLETGLFFVKFLFLLYSNI